MAAAVYSRCGGFTFFNHAPLLSTTISLLHVERFTGMAGYDWQSKQYVCLGNQTTPRWGDLVFFLVLKQDMILSVNKWRWFEIAFKHTALVLKKFDHAFHFSMFFWSCKSKLSYGGSIRLYIGVHVNEWMFRVSLHAAGGLCLRMSYFSVMESYVIWFTFHRIVLL